MISTAAASRSPRGRVIGTTRHHPRGPRREQHELIGEQDGFSRVVRDEDRRRRPRRPDLEQKVPQMVGGALIERHERLVQQQEVRPRGEGARQGHPAREPERQLPWIARQHVGDADRGSEAIEVGPRVARR